jgi:excisionase family DNA binding protein
MLSPLELDQIADQIAARVLDRLSGHADSDAAIDVHQVAELLSCSVPTVERLTRSGKLPSFKVGNLRRYRRAEILATQRGERE